MIEPRSNDAPLYCPRCGGLCDVEIGVIRTTLANYTEPFVWCLVCPFVSELGQEGALVETSDLALDMLQAPPACLADPYDFTRRRPLRARADS